MSQVFIQKAGSASETVLPVPSGHRLHLADFGTRPQFLTKWESIRYRQAHCAVECLAEAFGVFIFCYAGMGATASYILGDILKIPGIGSLLTIGLAYMAGIGLSLVIASGTSGGHFNPALTIVRVLFGKFPFWKGIRYIVAQILGGYVAALMTYWQWKHLIQEAEGALAAAGLHELANFSVQGPAGIFTAYVNPASPLGLAWVNEFMVDFFIGLVTFACLDPTNLLAPPSLAPWFVGLAYAVGIWSYSPNALAANAARDVGGRLAVITIWGLKASGGRYAAIAALTNIPATIVAYLVYEVLFVDSSRVVTHAHKELVDGHMAHEDHQMKTHLARLLSGAEEKGPVMA
ncbi:aquaporin-like protein [Auriscalpium vulgare]|uniref:Aquaporin-like protein n=1 Tax=Auriscalpium vulgare TaxID=40419 RepID=A0ACB8RDZ4_9AGAM|nr:aquaporin-like protein [Auriscalpium vulgare]